MSQVVTVSAVTAAYATQALKASARVSGWGPVEKTVRQQAKETMAGEDGPTSTQDIIGTSAMTLFFLTAGEKRNQPQTSRRRAEQEYLFNNLDETLQPPKEAEESFGNVPPQAAERETFELPGLPDLTGASQD